MKKDTFEKAMRDIDDRLLEEAAATRSRLTEPVAAAGADNANGAKAAAVAAVSRAGGGTGRTRGLAGIIAAAAVILVGAAVSVAVTVSLKNRDPSGGPAETSLSASAPNGTAPAVTTLSTSGSTGGEITGAAVTAPTDASTEVLTNAPTAIPTNAPTAPPTERPTEAPTDAPLTVPVTGYFKLVPGGQHTARSIEERALHCQYCFVVLGADGSGFYNWFGKEYELEWRGEQLFAKTTGEEIRYEYDSESGRLLFKAFSNTVYAGSELTFERSDETAPRRNEYTFFNEITGKYNTPYQRMDEITFAGRTVIDNEQYYLRLGRIGLDDTAHYLIYLNYQNRSDKHLYLRIDDLVVNGVAYGASYYSEGYVSDQLHSGYIYFNSYFVDTFLIKHGLADPTVISFSVELYEREGGVPYSDRTVLFSERVTIYPLGEENARVYEYVPEADDVLLADNDYFSLYLTGLSEPYNEKYTPYMDMILINKTDDQLWLAAENLKINGVQLFEGLDGINDDRSSPTLFNGIGPGRISILGWSWDYYLSAEEHPELVGKVDLDTVHTVEFDIVVCDVPHLFDYKAVCRAEITVECD